MWDLICYLVFLHPATGSVIIKSSPSHKPNGFSTFTRINREPTFKNLGVSNTFRSEIDTK